MGLSDKIKKGTAAALGVALTLSFLVGCNKISMSESRERLIVEYAADVVLENDANYDPMYLGHENQTTTEPQETTRYTENATTKPQETTGLHNQEETTTNNDNQNETTGKEVVASLNTAFPIEGLNFAYKGYLISETYPNYNNELGFIMTATDEHQLLVIVMNVTNTTSKDIELNMLKVKDEYSIKCNINDKTKLNVQMTIVPNALNSFEGTIKANESKELVLIFQIKDELKNSINALSLSVTNKSGTSIISLKK